MKHKHTLDYVNEATSDLEQTLADLKGAYINAPADQRLTIVLDYHLNLGIYRTIASTQDYEHAAKWLDDVKEVFELRIREKDVVTPEIQEYIDRSG